MRPCEVVSYETFDAAIESGDMDKADAIAEVLLSGSLDARFARFHAAHPEVYEELVRRARYVLARGRDRYSIKTLWEVIRWHFAFERDAEEEFKLNNNYHSRYARLIMLQEPDLADFFEVRILRT